MGVNDELETLLSDQLLDEGDAEAQRGILRPGHSANIERRQERHERQLYQIVFGSNPTYSDHLFEGDLEYKGPY